MILPTDLPQGAWCEIYGDRIADNLRRALGLLPRGAQFCAVLKADAYGHGIENLVPLICAQGVRCVGITSNEEARAVRAAGFDGRLIRLRAATGAEMAGAAPERVEEQIGSLSAAEHIAALGPDRPVHLALNAAGLSRDGLEIATEAGRAECRAIVERLGPQITGICTHYPCNSPAALRENAALFAQQAAWVFANSRLNRRDVLVHAGSSLTLVSGQPVHTDMFRCGAILYGILKPELGFRPTMALRARVVSVGTYPQGMPVGYDRAHRLDRDRRLAAIAIGYAGGFRRNGQGRSYVRLHNQLVPVLGKMSMNAIIADVTDLSEVQIGDVATLFGGDGPQAITPDMAEQQFATIMADLYTDWGNRTPRYRGRL